MKATHLPVVSYEGKTWSLTFEGTQMEDVREREVEENIFEFKLEK
jgi:hypothetical protein